MTAFIMVAVYLGLTCIISLINKNRQSSTRNTFVAKNGMPACKYYNIKVFKANEKN